MWPSRLTDLPTRRRGSPVCTETEYGSKILDDIINLPLHVEKGMRLLVSAD